MANSKEVFFKRKLVLNTLVPLFSLHLTTFLTVSGMILSMYTRELKYYIFLIKNRNDAPKMI